MQNKGAKVKFLLYTILIGLISAFLLIFHFSKNTFSTLMTYAEAEANKLVSTIINKIVLEEIASKVDFDQLFQVTKDKNGEIQTVDFDSLAVNSILSFVTNSVEENLGYMESGNLEFMNSINLEYKPSPDEINRGIVAVIPLGVSLKNHFFSNLGPKIPVKLRYVGSVSTNLTTNIKDYGINNALIELSIHIMVVEQVNIPFNSKKIIVENDIPIALKVVQGKVPTYYGNAFSKSSPIFSTNIDK